MLPYAHILTYIVLQVFWIGGAVLASSVEMLTVSEMKGRGIRKGLPYIMHFGMWNDVVVVHPWASLTVGLFSFEWLTLASSWLVGCFVLALAISWGANIAWTRHKNIAEAHGWNGHMSPVGMIHIPHMTIIVSVILMTIVWFFKGEVPWKFFAGSVFLLGGHICMGFHWPVKIFSPEWNPFPIESWIGTAAVLYGVFTSLGLFFIFWHFLSSV